MCSSGDWQMQGHYSAARRVFVLIEVNEPDPMWAAQRQDAGRAVPMPVRGYHVSLVRRALG
jgi:hypothetical protein